MRTPAEAIKEFILQYEGRPGNYLSMDPADSGNWYKGKLVGSNYGVTAATLATHRGVTNITQKQMQAVTIEEAVEIGLESYYRDPGFDQLIWCPPTEAWVDHGWLSGPRGAVMMAQRLIETAADGIIGAWTCNAYKDWLQLGLSKCCLQVYEARKAHFSRIVAKAPNKRKYLVGWTRRAAGFTAANKVWWTKWQENSS